MDDYLFGDIGMGSPDFTLGTEYDGSYDPNMFSGAELAPNNDFFNTDFSNSDWTNGAEFGNFGDYFGNSAMTSDPTSGNSGSLSTVNKFLNGLINGGGGDLSSLLNNGAALLGGAYDLYNGYNQNQQGIQSMKLQNDVTQAALKSNANNDYRAFTTDAGGYTNDALTSSMIAPRYDLLTSLMAGDKNLALSQGDRGRISSAFSDITDRYTPVYEGFANDMVNRRNEQYSTPYNSNAPFPEQMGIPAGTSPETINAYLKTLGVA